jgi:hypothetical protein
MKIVLASTHHHWNNIPVQRLIKLLGDVISTQTVLERQVELVLAENYPFTLAVRYFRVIP